jgi:hypothetical protein
MEQTASELSETKINIKFRKMMICLISICDMTHDFIKFQQRNENNKGNFKIITPNDEVFKHIIQMGSNEKEMKIKINPNLLNLSLLSLVKRFNINMFQNFLFIGGIRFENSPLDKTVRVLIGQSPKVMSFPPTIQTELFVIKRKRKDDMMSSLLKFNQRHVLDMFKETRTFKLIKDVKKDFKKEYFGEDPETAKIYYCNLFNRKNLCKLGVNKRLLEQIQLCYQPDVIPKMFHEYFMKAKSIPILDLKTNKFFSKEFVKLLKKKHMNLSDALFSFYRIEDYIFKSVRSGSI